MQKTPIIITEDQLLELYAFTRKHFVEHYDLQTELVDHLANDIEQMWQENETLPFNEARDKAFKKFGIFGFSDAIEQKQKAMGKRYRKYFWNEIKQWFKLPQIIITLSLFGIFYTLFSSKLVVYFAVGIYIILGVWMTFQSIKLNKQFRKRKEISNKKWMLEEMIYRQAGSVSLVVFSNLYNVFNITDKFVNNIYAVIGLAAVMTLFTISNYISFKLIPDKAETLLNETYPEFCL